MGSWLLPEVETRETRSLSGGRTTRLGFHAFRNAARCVWGLPCIETGPVFTAFRNAIRWVVAGVGYKHARAMQLILRSAADCSSQTRNDAAWIVRRTHDLADRDSGRPGSQHLGDVVERDAAERKRRQRCLG